jgi:energy-coupling factor transporter ATP-binding protein EcfA2
MARISTVAVRRFKGLEDVQIALSDATLLIGANNSGKSSILQAIHFAVSVAQTAQLVGEGVSWRSDAFELSINPSQLIYSPVADVMSLATGGTLQERRDTQIEIEFIDDTGARCIVGLRRGRNRNIAISILGRQIGEALMDVEHPFTVYAPGLAGVPKEERFLSAGVVRRIVARGDANLTLRNVLRMLHLNTESWNLFIEDMRSIFDGITIDIVFDVNTDENIEVRFQLPGGPSLPVDAAGTSILQASQILSYVALFKPRVLILDEPDSHLHPDNQRALCDLVRRLASSREFQALIATHSRHVLDAMKGRSNIVWLSRGRIVEEQDLSVTAMLLDLGALDSVDYFATGEIRCVVATEDVHREALKAVLWSNGFPEDDTEVTSYSGCTKIDAALVLGGFLRDKAPNVHVVIHRDGDYVSEEQAEAFTKALTDAKVSAFVTESNDIEGYFLNPDHLHELNPGLPTVRISELLEQATAETEQKSVEAMVNQRTQEAFRLRRAGGDPPNHGAIAVEARAQYVADPGTLRRGKEVLNRLRALLQQELGHNPRIFFPSQYLTSPRLTQIAQTIWPEAGAQ